MPNNMQQGAAANVPNVQGIEVENQPNQIAFDMPQIEPDRKSTRLNSSHSGESRMPSSA